MDRDYRNFKGFESYKNTSNPSLFGDSIKKNFGEDYASNLNEKFDHLKSDLNDQSYRNNYPSLSGLSSLVELKIPDSSSISLPQNEGFCTSNNGISCTQPVTSNISVFAGINMDGNPRAPMPDYPDIPSGHYAEFGLSYKF